MVWCGTRVKNIYLAVNLYITNIHIWIHHNITILPTHYYNISCVTYSLVTDIPIFYFVFWNLGLGNIVAYVFRVFSTLHAALPALLATAPCDFAGRTWLLLFALFQPRGLSMRTKSYNNNDNCYNDCFAYVLKKNYEKNNYW